MFYFQIIDCINRLLSQIVCVYTWSQNQDWFSYQFNEPETLCWVEHVWGRTAIRYPQRIQTYLGSIAGIN
jgi:hypothetical protein